MSRSRTPRCQEFIVLLAGLAAALTISHGFAPLARAEEPTGLQAAAAIEQAMISAIANAEKSVVSIARISADESPSRENLEFAPGGVPQLRQRNDPRDPEFVPKEWATGIVIDAKGLILTNYHCVEKRDIHLITTINRKVFRCTLQKTPASPELSSVYAADPRSDLAILKVDEGQKIAKDDFVPIKFGDAKTLRKGQIVITLGNPYGIARDGQVSASWGIISNLSRKLGPKPAGEEPTLHQFGTLIQTDARLNWTTSGGALVNLKGEMVGLTTSRAAASGYEQAAGFAIPIDDTFKRIINTLREGRLVEYGFLGVRPDRVLKPEETQGRHGLEIAHVTPGGPADRGQISDRDIITHIQGEPVRDFDDLRLLIGRFSAGDAASVTYERAFERGGGTFVADVVLGKYRRPPINKAREPIVSVDDPDWRGLRVDFATAVIDLRPGSDHLLSNVAVVEVLPDTPAFRAGLRPGMFVSAVGNTPIDSPADFRRAVARLSGSVTLKTIMPGDFRFERPVTVEAK